MKKKTPSTNAEKKNREPGSWAGALAYATIGTLMFCAVAGAIDTLPPNPTGLDSLWLCFAAAIALFLILLMAYWITVSFLKGVLIIGTSTKVALIFPSLIIAVVSFGLLLGNTEETKPCPVTITTDCHDGECVKTYNGHRVIKEYTLRAVDFLTEPEHDLLKSRLVLTVEDSNGNITIMKADSQSAMNTVLNGDYTGKQSIIGAEGGIQKVYIVEPASENSKEGQLQQDKFCQ